MEGLLSTGPTPSSFVITEQSLMVELSSKALVEHDKVEVAPALLHLAKLNTAREQMQGSPWLMPLFSFLKLQDT